MAWITGAHLYGGTLLVLLLCGIGLPIPEEATFLTAGYMAANIFQPLTIEDKVVHLTCLCLVGVLGIVMGDSVPFLVGKYYGRSLVRRHFFSRLLSPARMERTKEFFRKHGSKTVFCARFVAGLRMPTFFVSASLGVRYRDFLFWDTLGALISCPTSILAAYFLGQLAEQLLATYKLYALGFIVGVVAAVLVLRPWWHKKKGEQELRQMKAEEHRSVATIADSLKPISRVQGIISKGAGD
ncbi:MAG: DedA family protein [Planctomycetota bacterium]